MATVLDHARQTADAPAPVEATRSHLLTRQAARTAGEWLTLAWVLWWSWAYVKTALAQRFPEWLGWTNQPW